MSQSPQPLSGSSRSRSIRSRVAVGLAAFALAGPLAAAPASDDKPLSPQQKKMSVCSKEAKGKSGDDRRSFMKKCLSAKAESKADAKVRKG